MDVYNAPLRPGGPLPVVQRGRLVAELQGLLHRRLALVLAPGGYGKTTLLRELEQRLSQIPFAWCSLEPGGGSLPAFLRALSQAITPHLPEGTHIAALGGATGSEAEVRELALQFAADLTEQPEEHLVIVLDDLHHADRTPEVWTFLDALIAALPPGVHILAASRTRPHLPLARLQSRGDLLQVNDLDLSFSAEEARRFFEHLGLHLDEEELQVILQRTEGWATGLLLVANAGRGRPAAERLALLRKLEDRRDLFEYMAQEVFAAQPPELQDFLLHTAVLGTLDPVMVHELLPGAPVGRLMEQLEERNLFLVVDPRTGHYRYHHLFRGFLSQQALRHLGAPALAALHRRVANSVPARRRPDWALNHLLAAEDWAAATPLMAALVDAYLKGLRQEDVHGWLQSVPGPLLDSDPDFLYVRLQLATWLNQFDVASALYERTLDLCMAAGNRTGLLRTLNSLQHHYYKVRRPFVGRVAQQLSQSPDPELAVRGKQLLAAGLIAEARWHDALHALEELVPQMPAGSMARCNCQENLALFSFLAADFRRCLQHGVEEVAARNAQGDFSWGVYNWASHVFLGDVVGLEMYHRQFAAMEVPPAARRLFTVVTQMGQGILHQMKGEWAQAVALYEGLRPYYNDGHSLKPTLGPDTTFVVRAELARIYHRQGRLDEAGELLERNLGLTASYTEVNALACAQLAEHHAARGDLQAARTYLDKARAALPPGLVGVAALAVGLAAARVHWIAGEAEAAAAALDTVLAAVLEKGCAFLVVHYGGEPLVPVLAHLLQVPQHRDRAVRWAQALGAEAGRFLGALASHPDPAVVRGAAALLGVTAPAARQGAGAAAPELRVYALGRCEAYVHDHPVGGPDWNRAKVKMLLIGLLLRKGRPASRDELLRWLWPETAAAAGRTNLRVTLHGLKRALEPGLSAGDRSRFIGAARDEIALADPARVWFDLWEFEDRITRGRQTLRQGQRAEGLALLREAVSLWHGPLLPGPVFAGHLGERRARVEQAYLRACLDLAQDALDKGEPRAAVDLARKALQADPAAEPAFQVMIRAHLARGDRDAALLAWKACRKYLRQHLGVEPSPETARLLK